MLDIDEVKLNYTQGIVISVPKKLLCIMDWDEAVVLSYLINKWVINGGKPWFECSVKEVQNACCMTEREQKTAMGKLRRSYVCTEQRGMPSKRCVIIDLDILDRDVNEHIKNYGDKKVKNGGDRTRGAKNGGPGETAPYSLLLRNNSYISRSKISTKKDKNRNEFISTKKPKKTHYKEIDLERAEALSKELSKKNKITVQYSTKRWANEFAKLRRIDGIENDKISTVFNWYLLHIGDKYIPKAYSAKTFREKFTRLAELAEESQPVSISPEVASLSRELEQFKSWPKNSKKDVEVSCQVCFDSYQEFFRKLTECQTTKINREHLPNTKKHYRVAVRETIDYLWKVTPSASSFTREWMSRVSDRISKWDKWNGDLRSMAWNGNIHNADFLKFFMPYLQNYSTSGLRYWDTIKELM